MKLKVKCKLLNVQRGIFRMKKKNLLLFAMLLVLALFLAACGGGDDTDDGGTDTDDGGADDEGAADGESPDFLSLLTGGTSGTYYPLGGEMAANITEETGIQTDALAS